ncbi:MAG: repressor LexA [Gemmatimonadetes bacterium]|nr:repressor LexA [Gemmatimonadota bacterium]
MTPAPQRTESTSPLALTEIEQKILEYMVEFLRANTYQPSIRDIAQRFGIKSTKTVSEHLQSLADKGYLERDPSRSRGVRILGVELSTHAISVPCYRDLPDGNRGLMSEQVEMKVAVDRRLAGSAGSFFLRVRDEGLTALGFCDGDLILVEPAFMKELQDGDVVAARVTGDAVVGRFYRREGRIVLDTLHPADHPQVVDDAADFVLLGRVTALFRRLDRVPAVAAVAAVAAVGGVAAVAEVAAVTAH